MSIWTKINCSINFILAEGEQFEPDKDLGKSLILKWEVVDENNYTPREVSKEGGWEAWKKNHRSRKEREAMDDRYWAEHRKRQKRNIKWCRSKEFGEEMKKRWGEYEADKESYMPVGSEGGCHLRVYKSKTRLGDTVYTVKIFGALRDYEDERVPIEYFKEKVRTLAIKTEMIKAKLRVVCDAQEKWEYANASFSHFMKYKDKN